MFNIEQKPVSKHEDRRGNKPIIIVNHISAGTMSSMYNTFSNPTAKAASSHFGISRKGEIVQYVSIERAAWTQGGVKEPTAPIIRKYMGNPNLYAVSIEHEGYEGNGLQGDLTEEQFVASCWLHKYIQSEVKRLYGNSIALTPHYVIGHYQITIGKPYCPGVLFPWTRLYTELAAADQLTLEEYEEKLLYKSGEYGQMQKIVNAAARVQSLLNTISHEKYGEEAKRKLILLGEYMAVNGWITEYTPETVAARVNELYSTMQGGNKWSDEATRKLTQMHDYMLDKGWI